MPDMPPELQAKLVMLVSQLGCIFARWRPNPDCPKSDRPIDQWCPCCRARKWLVENPKQEADPIRMQATELWKRLMAIRERAEASGRQLLNWDELERELGRPEETDNGDPA